MCESLEDAEGAPLLRFRVSSTEVGTAVCDITCLDDLRVKNFRLSLLVHLFVQGFTAILCIHDHVCAQRETSLYISYNSLLRAHDQRFDNLRVKNFRLSLLIH